MRQFFCVLSLSLCLNIFSSMGSEKNVPIQSRFARIGACVTTQALFAGSFIALERLGENSISYITSLLPYADQLATTKFPHLVSSMITLPLLAYTYVTYRQLTWYCAYILYSGKQISPLIARDTAQHLDSYVRCMEMIQETHKQLEELIAKAEACVAGSAKEQTLRLIGDSITAVFERELTDAHAYAEKVRDQLKELGLTDSCMAYSARSGHVTYMLDLSRIRELAHPDLSKLDIDILDQLIKNILDYWHTYLTTLAASIDKRVALCQKIHAIENFVSNVLNRPLFPAFEQQITPTPTIKEIFF